MREGSTRTTGGTTDADRGLRASLWTVALTGAAATLIAPFVIGTERMVGAGLGALLAVANLWAIAAVVRGFVRGAGVSWGAVALIKLAALLFAVFVIIKNGWADILALAYGYAALPVGIVIAELRQARSSHSEPSTR